jgi:hypothetical protein
MYPDGAMRVLTLSENLDSVVTTAALLNDPPPPGYTYSLPVTGVGLTSLWHDEGSAEAFRGFLQMLVEEWFRCGKKIMPEDASVMASGMGPVEGYSTETEWHISLRPKSGYEDGTMVRGGELDPGDPACSSWLWRVYWDYLHRFPPNIWFMSDGEVRLNFTTPVYSKIERPVALPPFLKADSPHMGCWLEAVLWFMLLLNSGHVQRLDRCTFCKRYFVRQREMKSGQVYKRGGPSCGECKGQVSKARTSDTRKDAKRRMLDIAAEAWAAWTQSHKSPDRHSAVAIRINAKCRNEIYVTTRKHRIESLWVKRNENEILARVQLITPRNGAKRNAKGSGTRWSLLPQR